MKFVLALAATMASTSLLVPTVASAQVREDVSTSVSIRNGDLTSADGQQRLKERTARAIRRMCADGGDRGIRTRSDIIQCRNEAYASADTAMRLAIAEQQTRLAARQ